MPKPLIRISNTSIAGGPSPKDSPDKPGDKSPIPDEVPTSEDPIREQIISEIEEEIKETIGDGETPDYTDKGTDELKLMLDEIRKKKREDEGKDDKETEKVTITLSDGSIFEKVTLKSKWYDSYYYVVYDYIHKPVLMNWWTCIDEYTIYHTRYVYISGATHSLPDEVTTLKTNEWRYDFNSVPLGKLRVGWTQGRHDIGNNSGGFIVIENDTLKEDDPIDKQFEEMFDDWNNSKSNPKVGTPTQGSSDASHVTGVKIGDNVYPADFFTKPHTLKELIELKLVDGKSFTQGLLNNLTQAEVLFYLEYFPYSEK